MAIDRILLLKRFTRSLYYTVLTVDLLYASYFYCGERI
jgi:hypothetical protein